METLPIIRQVFGEEGMSPAWVFEWRTQFRAGQTSFENNQHTGRSINSPMPNTVATHQRLICEDQHESSKTLLMRMELAMWYTNGF
jgi:hypothetical protein